MAEGKKENVETFAVGRERSNPVASLQASLRGKGAAAEVHSASHLVSEGWLLPGHYLEHLGLPRAITSQAAERRDGVVGLVIDKRAKTSIGYVDRLRAQPLLQGADWEARDGMPFRGLEILRVVLALFEARGAEQLANLLPEAKSYRIEDQLNEEIAGPSMTIAAVLAVLDAESGASHPLLERAVSLVQLQAEGGRDLCPVDGLELKLEAFQRECGHGSLCLVAPGMAPNLRADLERYFDEVWDVGSLRELGAKLDSAGLLADFGRPDILDRKSLDRVEDVIKKLGREDWQVERELDLARRLAHVARERGFAKDVPFARRRAAEGRTLRALRFQASLGQVSADAQAAVERVSAARESASYDELAAADVDLAASLYVDYRFEDMAGIMRKWKARLDDDPRLLAPSLRVKILGNLARALAVFPGRGDGLDGWRAVSEAALELQGLVEPSGMALTRGFYIGALLAAGDLVAAEQHIDLAEDELGSNRYKDNTSLWFLRFNRADLARRRGVVWEDPEMETEGLVKDGQFGRPLGYYFQATARQEGRDAKDAGDRFRRAAHYFAEGAPRGSSGLWHFVHLLRMGAAERNGDAASWSLARTQFIDFLERPEAACLAKWFGELPKKLPDELVPEAAAALESLLSRDPYLLGRLGN